MFTLKSEFKISKEDLSSLSELFDNMPGTKLTRKESDLVDRVYYQHIEKNIDNTGWRKPLYKIEQAEKWPSGSRVTATQAKRIVLNALVHCNERPELTNEQAAKKFHSMLDGTREPWRVVHFFAYEYKG